MRRRRASRAVVALCVAAGTPLLATASASASPSVLCGGYAACNVGEFTTHGYAAHSATMYWGMYAGNNCTNYVAYVESSAFAVATPSYRLGNAYQWPSAAKAHGVLVDHTPSVGAVAVWTGGASDMGAEGHVAVVEAVGPGGSYIVISQQHMLGVANGYDWTRVNVDPSLNQWEQWPSVFVHFTVTPVAQLKHDTFLHPAARHRAHVRDR